MFDLHPLDLILIFVYFLGITVLGVWSVRRIRSSGDFFMPRRFGKWMMAMHGFGTGAHSAQAVSVASISYTNGLSGIWYQWLWLFSTPFYWLIAPVFRRFRAITTADVYEKRYDRSVAILYACVGVFGLMVNIGLMLKGSGAVISSCFGGDVSADAIILVMTALFLIYGMAGGLSAAILTDFVQGILTIVFSFLLLPFIMNAVGGFQGLHAAIADPQMFSLFAADEITVFYVAVIALNGLIGVVAQPHTMGNCAAGKSEMDGRLGFTAGTLIKRICTVAWCFTGLAGVVYFTGREVDPDHVFGLVAREFLPQVLPGLVGLFLASLLASVMSSCDSFMIASSALFTENIYKPLVKGRTSSHYLRVGRLSALVIVLGGMLLAYQMPSVVKGLELFWKVGPMMGIAFWLGFFWRGMTAKGAWASMIGAVIAWWLSTQSFFITLIAGSGWAETLNIIISSGGDPAFSLHWQMIFYLTSGIIAGVITSLLSTPVDTVRLEEFYSLIRTPVKPGEEVLLKPCTLPEDKGTITRPEILPGKTLHLPLPSRTSVIGFSITTLVIFLLIYSVYLISR